MMENSKSTEIPMSLFDLCIWCSKHFYGQTIDNKTICDRCQRRSLYLNEKIKLLKDVVYELVEGMYTCDQCDDFFGEEFQEEKIRPLEIKEIDDDSACGFCLVRIDYLTRLNNVISTLP